jgi:uncharacterized membrane protein YphA (DoxX/SURF4 family)
VWATNSIHLDLACNPNGKDAKLMLTGSLASAASIAGIGVALLFLVAGVGKLFQLRSFRQSLLFIPFVSPSAAFIASLLVPIAEVAGSVAVLVGVSTGKFVVIFLCVGSGLAAIVSLRRNQRVPCMCFTSSSNEFLSYSTILRSAAFAILILGVPAGEPLILKPFPLVFGVVAVFIYLSLDAVARIGLVHLPAED